jgi:hypothetical protein
MYNEKYHYWKNVLIAEKNFSKNKSKKLSKILIKSNLDESVILNNLSFERIKTIRKQIKLKNQLNESHKRQQQEIERKIAYEKHYLNLAKIQQEFFKNLFSNGIFKHGFLIGFINTYLPTEKDSGYLNTHLDNYYINNLINSTYLSEPKIIKIYDFSERRYNIVTIDLFRVKIPFKIYTLNHSWDSIDNSFIQCVIYSINKKTTNEEKDRKWRRLGSILGEIDSFLNPDHPIISPRTTHGGVTLFKQGLINFEDLYNKTSEEFKKSWEELLNYFNLENEKIIENDRY